MAATNKRNEQICLREVGTLAKAFNGLNLLPRH